MAGIVNLVDSCNQYSILFRRACERSENDTFKLFADKTRELLDRFSYELQTEIRRIGGSATNPNLPADAERNEHPLLLLIRCELSLKFALDEYDRAFDFPLTAHTRAMLNRQRFEIQRAYEQLVQIRRVA